MADAVFSAALTSTSSSTPSSSLALTNNESARDEFGAIPYERVLTIDECAKLHRTTEKLGRLDPFVHIWVHDARTFRHGKESEIVPFSLRLHPSVPVAEIRDMIQEKFTKLSDYKEEREGCLSLLFDGRVLENDKPFAEYLSSRDRGVRDNEKRSTTTSTVSSLRLNARLHRRTHEAQQSWPKPFAGIVWVIPFRPQRTTAVNWASS